MSTMTTTFPRFLAVTALVGGLALAGPAFAAPASSTAPVAPAVKSAPAGKHMHHMHKHMHEDVEARIKTLHDKLKITADQEDNFTAVAQAMRDNEASMKTMWEERRDNGPTQTAVEDLESYQKIAQAHADATGKLVDAFKPLYDSLSDDQKKNADDVFGRFEGHRDSPEDGKAAHTKPTSKSGQ